MKMSGRNIIAVLGFTMLGVIVVFGFVLGVMFAFPNMKIGSVTAVDERNTQTIYKGAEITEILTSRNFIVESETAEVRFWMRKEGQGAKSAEDLAADKRPEGSIVVEESATGLSFNSIKRTHIEWTRTAIGGEEYYRIKVLEPKGFIKRKTPAVVYINLWRDSRVPDGTSTAPYNIILSNNKSIVRFGGDPVDKDAPEKFNIRNLTVNSAKAVYMPITPIDPTDQLLTEVENVKINGSGIPVDARCYISGNAEIIGGGNTATFASIGGYLSITGNKNAVTVESSVAGDVLWGTIARGVPNGSLNIRGSCSNAGIFTTDAAVDIVTVAGSAGAEMRTANGSLRITEITGGGLTFVATGTAGVSVGAVAGAVSAQMGTGAINLNNVRGNVDIKSDKANAGGVFVSFYPALTANPGVDIVGYDGAISVSNIRGRTNISVRDWENGTGRANIYAHFKRVDESVSITANTGYINGHETEANITVDLDEPIWGVLEIIGTGYAVSELSAEHYLKNSYTNGLGATFYLRNDTVIELPAVINESIFWNVVESVVGQVVHSKITVKTTTRFFLK
jgi:hypothetical protein